VRNICRAVARCAARRDQDRSARTAEFALTLRLFDSRGVYRKMFGLEQRCEQAHMVGFLGAAPWIICRCAQRVDPCPTLLDYNSGEEIAR
jgi:hypothetical protein